MDASDGSEDSLISLLKDSGPNLNMLYIWQSPMMLMSYSWVAFILALTLHVLTPLIRGHTWGSGTKV
jgi:hypothetical protein